VRASLLLGTAALIGVAVGLGGFTFGYARGYSYMTNDPAACANCHIMDEHYSAWLKSSHRSVAGCNDCHSPHDLVGKYSTKARNGFWHSFYFTTGNFPYPLRITERNHEIVEHNCRYCHERITEMIDQGVVSGGAHAGSDVEPLRCTRCHVSVGHWVR
jgi:cytochrome c nitrite reductase small subunit